jgi:SAM-dependent methyltransferase
MPGYGKQTAAAGRGFWRACADMQQVWNAYQNGSLLASNFNQLWCAALNLVHQGGRVDYFAMLHDDIGPEDFWLDKLIDELEAKQLDVLGAAVPIKDTRGMTSLALHRENDTWMPHARLSIHDCYELPETFTSDDLGRPLLLNTGCWLAKWNQEWCREVHFQINDRIVFNRACNRYQAQTEPEDWFFSRLCHELGLKIGATRKINLVHTGDVEFSLVRDSRQDAFDKEVVRVSPVPGAFPHDVPGWLLPAEGKKLAELSAGKRVLEIGSYCGRSTICIARAAESVTAVDYFDSRGATICRHDTRAMFDKNLERYGVAGKVIVCHPDAEIPLPEYDLAFIDGAHDLESVRADIRKAQAVLKPGGLIAFHDYANNLDFEVQEAVDEFLASGAELISVTDTLAVVRPPAAIPLEV